SNNNPLERMDRSPDGDWARGPVAFGSAFSSAFCSGCCVFADADCVGAGLAFDSGEVATRGVACALADLLDSCSRCNAVSAAVAVGTVVLVSDASALCPECCLDLLPLSPLRSLSPGALPRTSGTMSTGSNLRNVFFFSEESCVPALTENSPAPAY